MLDHASHHNWDQVLRSGNILSQARRVYCCALQLCAAVIAPRHICELFSTTAAPTAEYLRPFDDCRDDVKKAMQAEVMVTQESGARTLVAVSTELSPGEVPDFEDDGLLVNAWTHCKIVNRKKHNKAKKDPMARAIDISADAPFCRTSVFFAPGDAEGGDAEEAAMVWSSVRTALELRRKWMGGVLSPSFADCASRKKEDKRGKGHAGGSAVQQVHFESQAGIVRIVEEGAATLSHHITPGPSYKEFCADLHTIAELARSGPVKSETYTRLKTLESSFKAYQSLNTELEQQTLSDMGVRANCRDVHKVDSDLHLDSMMCPQELVDFIVDAAEMRGDRDIVNFDKEARKKVTLDDKLNELGLDKADMTVHGLGDIGSFTNYEFRLRHLELAGIFLRIKNDLDGRYLGEMTQRLFDKLDRSNTTAIELKITYGGKMNNRWEDIVSWTNRHLAKGSNYSRWVIHIPQKFDCIHRHKKSDQWSMLQKKVVRTKSTGFAAVIDDMHAVKASGYKSFASYLDSIFLPLFEVSKDPTIDPPLHTFLLNLAAFETTVDDDEDEDFSEHSMSMAPDPSQWDSDETPPFSYYLYYLYSNISALNQFRKANGLNEFSFRTRCDENGGNMHLGASFLTAHNISNGAALSNSKGGTCMQYMYYLAQIGITMSPLSSHVATALGGNNTFKRLYQRGLNITLSSSRPLARCVHTGPLDEIYFLAAQQWNLSQVDMCEIARLSLIQSNLPLKQKKKWVSGGIGSSDAGGFVVANNVADTFLPQMRIQYRAEAHAYEHRLVAEGKGTSAVVELSAKKRVKRLQQRMADCPFTRTLVLYAETVATMDSDSASQYFTIMKRRQKYFRSQQLPKNSRVKLNHIKGVMFLGVLRLTYHDRPVTIAISPYEFSQDLENLDVLMSTPSCELFAKRRLELLEHNFAMYDIYNAQKEFAEISQTAADFHSLVKINNGALRAFIPQKMLDEFIASQITGV